MRSSLRVDLILAAALPGCGESTAPTVCHGPSQVEIGVGSGPTPSLFWTPNCLVDEIRVRRLDGTTSTTGSLQPGQTYEVSVGVVEVDAGDAIDVVGSVRFTR